MIPTCERVIVGAAFAASILLLLAAWIIGG